MGAYTILESIDNKYLFVYIVIFLISIFYFRNRVVKLSIIFALGVAFIVVWYIYEKNNVTIQLEQTQLETKREAITPHPRELQNYDDVVDFMFSIQDMYHYNPKAYEEMIDNTDNFFKVYQIIKLGTPQFNAYFQIARTKAENAVNALHSMIFTIPNSPLTNDKHIRAHKRLETIMNKYTNELYDMCERLLLKNGRNVTTPEIILGPKPHNHYDDEDFSYQFY
jgi:Ca2+/Na+ antiporter